MTLPIFYDHNPQNPWTVTGETQTILSDGTIRLTYAPKKGSVSIAGFTESLITTPGLTEFYIDYQDATDYRTAQQIVQFSVSKAGVVVSVNYQGVTQTIMAVHMNDLKAHEDNTLIHLTSPQANIIANAILGTDSRLSDSRNPLAHNQAWSTITGTPTTIATSGITDVYSKTQVDSNIASNLVTAKSYTDSSLSGLIASAPTALNTLNELATALGDDPNFATTTATLIGTKAPNLTNWATSTSYALNQLVIYTGLLYYCSTAHTSTTTFDATKFTAIAGSSGGSGGSNLLVLLHTNNEETTSYNTFDYLFDGVIIPDFTRHTNKLILGAMTTGSGQVQVQITDGINTVTQNMTLQSNVTRKKDNVTIDCSTLTDVSSGNYWTVTVNALATTGDYVINKFNIQGNPVDFMSGQTLIVANPFTMVYNNTATVMDNKYFPINYAIDNSCQVRFLANVILGTGVTSAEIKCRLTTNNGVSSAYNETILTVNSSGIVQGFIDFPAIVAPTVQVQIFGRILSGTGVVTLNHWENWMEI